MPPDPAQPTDLVEVATQALSEGVFRLVKRVLGKVVDAHFVPAHAGPFAQEELDLKKTRREASDGTPTFHVAKDFEIGIAVTTEPPDAMISVSVEGKGASIASPYTPGAAGRPGRFTLSFDAFSKTAADVKTLKIEGRGDPRNVRFVVSPHQAIWANHPDRHPDPKLQTHEPCEWLPKNSNQCAARLSEAIDRAGFSLAKWKGYRCACKAGTGGGSQHYLRAQQVADLIEQHGLPGVTLGKRTVRPGKDHRKNGVTWKDYDETFGLVFFSDFWPRNATQKKNGFRYYTGDHVDIWHGGEAEQGAAANHDYFERSREVWFWPLH